MYIPQSIIDTANVVNAAAVLVLVGVTAWYAWSTRKILRAAERQAQVSEDTLKNLKAQVAVQAEVGRMIVANAIQTARAGIDYWKAASVITLAVRGALPTTIDLVPADADAALECAARISPVAAAELRSGFDCLRRVRGELGIMRGAQNTTGEFYGTHQHEVNHWLDMATAEIESAERHLGGEETGAAQSRAKRSSVSKA